MLFVVLQVLCGLSWFRGVEIVVLLATTSTNTILLTTLKHPGKAKCKFLRHFVSMHASASCHGFSGMHGVSLISPITTCYFPIPLYTTTFLTLFPSTVFSTLFSALTACTLTVLFAFNTCRELVMSVIVVNARLSFHIKRTFFGRFSCPSIDTDHVVCLPLIQCHYMHGLPVTLSTRKCYAGDKTYQISYGFWHVQCYW